MRHRHSCLLFFGVLISFLSLVLGSYDAGYGAPDNTYEASYAAPPVVHGQHGHGHSAGSYYHYHVPLVGQQQQYHHQPYHHQQSQHNELYYILPLLLLLALPLLFLPLLPLLLIPIGLSLLALIMPGGMMMMMMMMMMMPMMGPPGVRDGIAGRAATEMRSLGELVMNDVTSLASKYARSLDLDKCPERVACELGLVMFPANSSQALTAKTFMNYIVEQALPKGKTRKMFRSYRDAFWSGSSLSNCSAYQCQPTFRIFQDTVNAKVFPQSPQTEYVNPAPIQSNVKDVYHVYPNNTTATATTTTTIKNPNIQDNYNNMGIGEGQLGLYADYYTQYQHQLGNVNYTYTNVDENIAKAYYDYYANADLLPMSTTTTKEVKAPHKSKTKIKIHSNKFYATFGTPIVKS